MENDVRLIDANALAKELSSLSMIVTGIRAGKGVLREYMTEYRKSVLRIVDEAPTIDQESLRSVARWMNVRTMGGADCVQCSGCGYREYDHVKYTRFDYCPGCGARMKGADDHGKG